jgi:hypothetical protein
MFIVPIAAAKKVCGICQESDDYTLPEGHENNPFKDVVEEWVDAML